MLLNRRSFLAATGAAALSTGLGRPAFAQPVSANMILNWRYQGPQGWFFLAQDRGYFADVGVDLTMDQGSGSGAAVAQVAGGAYDLGFGDINAAVQLAAERPEEAPVGIYMMYNRPPFTIAVLSGSDIHEPKDLEGRVLGGAANDGALKLFPAFANMTGIDTSGIEIVNMQANLREQMLRTGQVEGVFGFVNTIRFSAILSGMNPDEEIRWIKFADHGMDLYSNCLIASRRMVDEQPEALKGIVAAINQGLKDTLADPEAAIDAVARREPLIEKDVELARLMATLEDEMSHPEGATYGIGAVDPDRFKRAIDIVVEANGLPSTPAPETIYTEAFLPAMEDRVTTLAKA
jgi:NitT/TauT family transport system substrate-binding protein